MTDAGAAAPPAGPDLDGAAEHPHPELAGRRILIGLSEISGYGAGLRKGFRSLGYTCDLLELSTHPFDYSEPQDPHPLAARIRALQNERDAARGMARKWRTVRILLLRARLLLWALAHYHVFIMNGHAFFLGRGELWLYRLLGKKRVFVSHGSDTRPPYIDGTFMTRIDATRIREAARAARRKKRLVRRVERSGATIVSAPAWAHFQERPFATYLVLGFPVHREAETGSTEPGHDPPRILHSPSRPDAKGTPRIRAIMDDLAAQMDGVAYHEVIGQPNQVVLERLAETDLVVDQMYASTPMAGFATEASLFGRPAVVGSYYADHVAHDVPRACIPPTAFVHPDAVGATVRRLAADPGERIRLGAAAQAFVRSRYDPAAVAARYVRLLVGEAPPSWWFDPRRIRYLHGGCIDEARSREVVARLVTTHGVRALRLRDKPDLEAAFVAYAHGAPAASGDDAAAGASHPGRNTESPGHGIGADGVR